jgi:CubicO group peptidase (beta-lactamase class C family)
VIGTVDRRRFLKRGAGIVYASAVLPSLKLWSSQIADKLKTTVPTEELVSQLKASIPQAMAKYRVPGLSIAIIRDASVVWTEGFGIKSTVTKEPVTAGTIFEAASLSKPVFAYAALRFFEKSNRSLDTPLTEFVSESFIKEEPRISLVTARHVLSHTSGLPHGREPRQPIRLRFTPGQRFAYSATGILYLQFVVEQLSKRKLRESIHTDVVSPFEMNNSNFGWLDRFQTEAAAGHGPNGAPALSGNGRYLKMTADEKSKLELDYPGIGDDADGASGLYTTAGDYARFMIEIMEPARQSDYHLSRSQVEEMLRSQISVVPGLSWGLGWGLEQTTSGNAFWHWGDWGVFRNFAIGFRDQKVGVVVLTNSFNGPQVYRQVIPEAIGETHPAFAWVNSYRP